MRQQVPEWFTERFFNEIKGDIEKNGPITVDWMITKPSMVAVLNHLRSKGYECKWHRKGEDQFVIKITPQ